MHLTSSSTLEQDEKQEERGTPDVSHIIKRSIDE